MTKQLTLGIVPETTCEECGAEESFTRSGDFRCCNVCGWWEHTGDNLDQWVPVTEWINGGDGQAPARLVAKGRAPTNRQPT